MNEDPITALSVPQKLILNGYQMLTRYFSMQIFRLWTKFIWIAEHESTYTVNQFLLMFQTYGSGLHSNGISSLLWIYSNFKPFFRYFIWLWLQYSIVCFISVVIMSSWLSVAYNQDFVGGWASPNHVLPQLRHYWLFFKVVILILKKKLETEFGKN